MTIEEQVLEKLCYLPPEQQKEVLDLVEFLKENNGMIGYICVGAALVAATKRGAAGDREAPLFAK